jgi:hypothetical protein
MIETTNTQYLNKKTSINYESHTVTMPLSIDDKCPLENKPELNEVKLGIFEAQHKEDFFDVFSKNWRYFQPRNAISVIQLLRAK